MNQPLQELANQCTTQYRDGNGGYIDHVDVEKFAELIVKETISVLQKRFMGDLNREDMEVRRCIADIQKHFGVE